MKVLVITNLFPNSKEPTRGIYNKQQFLELAKLCELKVVAPLPWHYKRGIQHREDISGIDTYHPRYFMIPKVGRSLYGLFFYLSLRKFVKNVQEDFKFDLIFATWAYPDGFGSFLIARALRKPIFIKVHGSDIDVHTKYWLRRKMIGYALRNSNKVVAVSSALKEKIAGMGIPKDKIAVISNGVDSNLFKPMSQKECREKLNLPHDKKIILYIGNLKKDKGVIDLLEAYHKLDKLQKDGNILVFVGEGTLRNELEEKAAGLMLNGAVRFAGTRFHNEIPIWINASDVFCLPSLHEGCPNVVLEALSCGKPVVATEVGGMSEIITSQDFGILVKPNRPASLMQALTKALNKNWHYQKIREEYSKFSWMDNAAILNKVFNNSVRSFNKIKSSKLKKYLKHFAMRFIPKKMIICKLRSNNKRVAITFDDGPNTEFTPFILTILKEKNIKATFFLIGEEIEKNKEVAKRIIKEGHCIGTHSYSHYKFSSLNFKRQQEEIIRAKESLGRAIGLDSNVFRPPQGFVSIRQVLYCFKKGITTVLWSIDSRDFEYKGSQYILDNVIGDGIKSGDIILLHDDNEFTMEALPKIIEYLQEKGYQFATIEEFLQ